LARAKPSFGANNSILVRPRTTYARAYRSFRHDPRTFVPEKGAQEAAVSSFDEHPALHTIKLVLRTIL
jgi:hypothetical protein